MKYRTILLFGAPGSGKGTQGRILGTIPGFYHCSCGDVFRRLRPETELGRVFLQYSSAGQLVPDEFTVALWRENLAAETQVGRFHPETDRLVLDGIPRNAHQAQMLADDLEVRAIFHLRADDDTQFLHRMQRRALKENRLDDASLDTVQRRFEVYARETQQVLGCYPAHLVHAIDAAQSPLRVLTGILGVIDRLDGGIEPSSLR